MDRLFNMDNKFFTVMGRVADLIMLNVVFLICCLPIVTLIAVPPTALHYVTLKMTRNEESYIIRSFFKSFKQNFKQATVINLIMLAVAAILYMDLRIVGNIGGTMSQVLYIVFFAFGILYMMVFLYIYPVLAKFYNSIKNTFRNAFDGNPSSSVYSPDGSHHSVTCRRVFYQKFPHTVHGHHASVHVWICTGSIYQRTFSGKDF